MKDMKLSPETRAMLSRLRESGGHLSVYDFEPDLAEQAVWEVVRPSLDTGGLKLSVYNQLRWCMRELSKVARVNKGWDLAFEIEVFLRKWHNYGLPDELLQALACAVVKGTSATEPAETPKEVAGAAAAAV